MSLLLLFNGGAGGSAPLATLVTTEPAATYGYPIQRPATEGEWRWVVELLDPTNPEAEWLDITKFYVGDRHQFGADQPFGDARARLVTVQLQIDNVQADILGMPVDILAPWGQDTTDVFGVDVTLDAGLLMRASMTRIVGSVVVEWNPIWTGRVESWGDESEARGQTRRHVVSVVDTLSDLANVPTIIDTVTDTWGEYFTDELLPNAGWLFGVDVYGDVASTSGYGVDLDMVAAINRMDSSTDPLGLVWRSLRTGRLVIHPAPWDTTNVARYDNPLLDVYPLGLKFSFEPDFTDIEYIQDDGQQPFGISRSIAGVLNSFIVTLPGPDVYAVDDPVSSARYGVRPFTATWAGHNPPAVDDLLAARAYASSQALPLRTTLDHEGFWSAMAIVDHLDPVTIVHANSDDGLVVTATGMVRNIVEERTFRGEAGGDYSLTWQSTVQFDLDATETTPALLPVEDLVLVEAFTPQFGGPSGAEFTWTNPTQPSVTPTEVQMRVIGRSLIWVSEDYPGVGADGTTVGFLTAATTYTFEVRLVRRVNGVVTHVSESREVEFTTPAVIWPTPVPDGEDTNVEVGEPPDFDPDDCELEVELQENAGSGWVTVDTFTDSELTDNGDGTWSLTDPIPNSFFVDGSMYRFRSREICGTVIGDWFTGPEFDPPDDWGDPCPTPSARLEAPFDDAIVYVPKVCSGAEDGDPDFVFHAVQIVEAVSGIPGVPGDALDEVLTGVVDPTSHILLAIADPGWSDTPGGIVAYGECPQTTGVVQDKSIACRVKVVEAETCVLFECAAMRITCTATSGGWRPGVTLYKVGSTISLAGSAELDLDVQYRILASHDYETGDIKLYVDGVEDNTVGGSDNVATINALPIWRVGAPPESWITDCAVWDAVIAPAPPPPPTYSDDFNRANNTTLGANWGQDFDGGGTGVGISSNQAVGSGSSPSYFTFLTLLAADQFCQFDSIANAGASYFLRLADAGGPRGGVGTGYEWFWTSAAGGTWTLRKWASALPTVITTFTGHPTPLGTTMRFEIEGTTLRVKQDGVTIITTSDATYSNAGYVGGRLDTGTLDNFVCGEL